MQYIMHIYSFVDNTDRNKVNSTVLYKQSGSAALYSAHIQWT